MSNQYLPTPYIAQPPIYIPFFMPKTQTIDPAWVNWINSITNVMGRVIVHDWVKDLSGKRIQEVALLQAISMAQAERDNLDSARNGTVLYNTTTNRMNFRENNAWVTFTPIPA